MREGWGNRVLQFGGRARSCSDFQSGRARRDQSQRGLATCRRVFRMGRITTERLMAKSWHVVQVHPRSEPKVQIQLTQQSFGACLSLYLKRRRHARRTETVAVPLYSSYLSVTFDASMPCLDSIQSAWRGWCATAMCRPLSMTELWNSCVDEARASQGVFSDCLGTFEGLGDRKRVAILPEPLDRKVRVVLDEELVVAA